MKKRVGALLLGALLVLCLTSSPVFEADAEQAEETPNLPVAAEETEPEVTGVIEKDGKEIYVVEGVFKKVTGVVQRVSDGKDVYVEDGFFKPATGVAKRLRDRKEVYVKAGCFQSVTDLAPSITDAKKKLYVRKGIFQKNLTGVVKLPNKKQVYIQKGIFKKATGIAKRLKDQKWVYIKKGVFKKSTGVARRLTDKKQLYVRKGVLKKFTGLAKQISNRKWVFVKNGALVTNPKQIRLTKTDQKAGRQETLNIVYARTIYRHVTTKKMTKKQKLRACFDYVVSKKNFQYKLKRIPYYRGYDWPTVYIGDMIADDGSICHGFSALFGYLASICGYRDIYLCAEPNNGHAWVEIGGRVYDPVFMASPRKRKQLIFGSSYREAVSYNLGPNYSNDGYESNPWMRIQVPELSAAD